MITLSPPWREIAAELRHRYGTDDAVADELSKRGVIVERTSLYRLRSGEYSEPRVMVGIAMLSLLEIPKAHVRVRARKAADCAAENAT